MLIVDSAGFLGDRRKKGSNVMVCATVSGGLLALRFLLHKCITMMWVILHTTLYIARHTSRKSSTPFPTAQDPRRRPIVLTPGSLIDPLGTALQIGSINHEYLGPVASCPNLARCISLREGLDHG